MLFDQKYNAERNTYVPIYDSKQQIIGHQWLPEGQNGIYVQLVHNDEKIDYQFATDLAHSSFKQFYKENEFEIPLLTVIESKISPTLLNHVLAHEFEENEITIILDRQIRTILNIHQTEGKHIPFQFGLLHSKQMADKVKKELLKTCDFYQPIEILKG